MKRGRKVKTLPFSLALCLSSLAPAPRRRRLVRSYKIHIPPQRAAEKQDGAAAAAARVKRRERGDDDGSSSSSSSLGRVCARITALSTLRGRCTHTHTHTCTRTASPKPFIDRVFRIQLSKTLLPLSITCVFFYIYV